jgi:restriction system protein
MTVSISVPDDPNIQYGDLSAKYDRYGIPSRYYIPMSHSGLKQHKDVSATELDILQIKVEHQVDLWRIAHERQTATRRAASAKEQAERLTRDADAKRAAFESLLARTLNVNDEVDWDSLKDSRTFQEERFDGRKPFPHPKRPKPVDFPKPLRTKPSLWQRLTGKKKQLDNDYAAELQNWLKRNEAQEAEFLEYKAKWEAEKLAHDQSEERREKDFRERQEIARTAFNDRKAQINERVDALKKLWAEGDPNAIEEHATIVLESSDYSDLIQKDFEVQFKPDTRTLAVNYRLPAPADMPNVKSYRAMGPGSVDEQIEPQFKETMLSQRDQKDLYNRVCYQICLRTIHEIYEADTPEHVAHIAFNGVVRFADKATGQDASSVILSIVAKREEFLALNLAKVDPRECFKALKGISASTLTGLTPIQPVIEIDKSDRRFVAERPVLAPEMKTNLAALDWEDFEHLVRELFEREFSSRGGDVKVTRASQDGGVDAVAFDPDPISGGKIVIQAKRYTNTVGVSAVRDLYGTLMNEGAMKGILVTTADYGPDAYEWASGKPLTLMSGNNLLHLLEKHGIEARIDLRAAKQELAKRHGH